jgi:hypothetical protein
VLHVDRIVTKPYNRKLFITKFFEQNSSAVNSYCTIWNAQYSFLGRLYLAFNSETEEEFYVYLPSWERVGCICESALARRCSGLARGEMRVEAVVVVVGG